MDASPCKHVLAVETQRKTTSTPTRRCLKKAAQTGIVNDYWLRLVFSKQAMVHPCRPPSSWSQNISAIKRTAVSGGERGGYLNIKGKKKKRGRVYMLEIECAGIGPIVPLLPVR